MTLLFPQWLQGYHAPEAPLQALAGLNFTSEGRSLAWRRDPLHVHAFHIEMPEGAEALGMDFQLLTPTCKEQGRVGVTARQLDLQWNTVLLYPAGYSSGQITVFPAVTLPPGWQFATALKAEDRQRAVIDFSPVTLDELVDSPLFAGQHFRHYPIGRDVVLNVLGDDPSQIDIDGKARAQMANLVAEVDMLFGARPFTQYDFLISLSEELGDLGVEHRRSCELVLPTDFFSRWDGTRSRNDVLAHEYIHAWNGKFRRGRGACTDSFDQAIRNDLLWVYEGLTQYWSHVLSVRSGLWDAQMFRDALALITARCCNMKGRAWRPLQDTTNDPVISAREPLPWESWQRNQDYYTDGQLLWLEVDIMLRQKSGQTRSLDDFGRVFFGMAAQDRPTLPYDLEDVVTALNGIVPWDWGGFFDGRLNEGQAGMPLKGITAGGYQLVYLGHPSAFHRQTDAPDGLTDLTFSAGFSASASGRVEEVIWESPAFQAGLTVGNEILAVNGKAFSTDNLVQAVGESADASSLRLEVRKLKHVEQVRISYGDGHRFPHLRRLEGSPALLDAILEARR